MLFLAFGGNGMEKGVVARQELKAEAEGLWHSEPLIASEGVEA